MSQRALVIFFSIGLVLAVGLSALVNWGMTSSMIAAATIAGPAGPAGPAGTDGADGADGTNGVDGTDGVPGSSTGVPGQRGPTGPSGPSGPAGTDGTDAAVVAPIVLNTGAGTASVPHFPTVTPVTGAGLSVPAGVYAITVTATSVSAVITSGGGVGSQGTVCYLYIDGNSTNESFDIPADGSSNARTIAYLQSFSGTGLLELRCYSYFGMGFPITNQVSWSDLEISATRLD